VGLTNIKVTFDYDLSSGSSSTACRLDWSANNGSTWNTGVFNGTSTSWVCANTVTLPAGAAGVTQLKIRFVNPGTSGSRYAYVDYVSITGTTVASGSWTANAQVSLVGPSAAVTVLKAYGSAEAGPYNVLAYYTGPGTYQLRLEENLGGTATATAATLAVSKTTVQCASSSCVFLAEVAPGDSYTTAQTWSDKQTTSWPSLSGATSYTLYYGLQGDLPNLLTSATDSCVKYSGSSTSVATITEDPSSKSGGFYWFLITASNTFGEGNAGNATGGSRVVNVKSAGSCPP